MRRSRLSGVVLALAALAGGPALAHPHVWVTARAEILYRPDGRIAGVRHAWTFDPGYSGYMTQGLDTDRDGTLTPDELQGLARENAQGLAEFDFFTFLRTDGRKQEFGEPTDPAMTFADGALTLTFLLPLRAPAPSSKAVSLEIYDPTYFVSFGMAAGNGSVTLNGAPEGCAVAVTGPKLPEPLSARKPQQLSETFFQALTASSDYGVQFANRIRVACP